MRYKKIRLSLALWLTLTLLLSYAAPTGLALTAPKELSTDLRLTMQAAPNPVVAGSTLVYHLNTTNVGPDPATSVILAGDLPEGVTYQSFDAPTGVTCNAVAQALTCALGVLTSGQTRAVSVTVAVDPGARGVLTSPPPSPAANPIPSPPTTAPSSRRTSPLT